MAGFNPTQATFTRQLRYPQAIHNVNNSEGRDSASMLFRERLWAAEPALQGVRTFQHCG
jgi:hypothetical protein